MATVHFIQGDGTRRSVEAEDGSLMELAMEHEIEGVENSCGGSCSCATCHVHIAKEWMAKVGEPNEMEKEILEYEEGVSPQSRLSCQVELSDALDGLVVEVIED